MKYVTSRKTLKCHMSNYILKVAFFFLGIAVRLFESARTLRKLVFEQLHKLYSTLYIGFNYVKKGFLSAII